MVPRAAKSDHVDKKYQDKEERENAETNDAENKGAETQNADLTPNSAAAKQVDKWTTVKKESDHDDPAPMVEALKFQEAAAPTEEEKGEKIARHVCAGGKRQRACVSTKYLWFWVSGWCFYLHGKRDRT